MIQTELSAILTQPLKKKRTSAHEADFRVLFAYNLTGVEFGWKVPRPLILAPH